MASIIVDNGQCGIFFANTTSCNAESDISARDQDNLYLAGACRGTTTVGSEQLGASVSSCTAPSHAQDAWNNWWGTASAGDIDEFVLDGTDDRDTSLIHCEPRLLSSSLS
jgi:hypothetical protein